MKRRRVRKRGYVKQGKIVVKDLLRPAEVDLLLDLWETGMWSFETLAEKFEISPGKVKLLVAFKQTS